MELPATLGQNLIDIMATMAFATAMEVCDESGDLFESATAAPDEAPQYTRPVEFEGEEVPAVLRQGNHKEIAKWGEEKALEKMKRVRPDLQR